MTTAHRILQFNVLVLVYWRTIYAFVSPSLPLMGQQNFGTATATRRFRARASSSQLYGMFDESEDIEGDDRFKSCIPYILPLLDGDEFGRYIYQHISPLGFLNSLFIGPLAEFYRGVPFLDLLLFMTLTLGTRFNDGMNRNVRFNAQQATLVTVALILPEIIARSVDETGGVPQYIVEGGANFVWYSYMSIVLYSVVGNLRGRKPNQVPYLSALSEFMIGPF